MSAKDDNMTCRTLESYPNFHETFVECPSVVYTIFSSLNVFVAALQTLIFLHLLYVAPLEKRREAPYLVSLAPICSIISVIVLFNPSTAVILAAFRYVYLVFCILQFYQYLTAYYGEFRDAVRLLPGFTYDADVCCCCCSFTRTVVLTKKRLITNKASVYTGIITYIVIIMATLAFEMKDWVEDLLLIMGVMLYLVAIVCAKRLIVITRQFYPELAENLQQKWNAVRIIFIVIGLQGLLLRTLGLVGAVPPVDIFNDDVMVDVIHNMVVPAELLFAMVLAHRAFSREEPATLEVTPLLQTTPNTPTTISRISQTEDVRELLESTLERADSGSPHEHRYQSFGSLGEYGSLSLSMMEHIDRSIEESLRKSNPDLDEEQGSIPRSRSFPDRFEIQDTNRSTSSSPGATGPRANFAKGERYIQML